MSFRDNPMVMEAAKNLTPEQKAEYEAKGESLHGDVDFVSGQVNQQFEYDMSNLARLVSAVKSGLHPNDLTIEEQLMLERQYGKRWKTKLGFL